MFTVCPKCALTLVVSAADLRVAQGYVRCGRCSNVFNAIVGLSEAGGGAAGQGQGAAQAGGGTASTSIIRKAPSIADDDPPPDPLSDTGESEAIYAEPEPDTQEVSVQDIFADTGAPLHVKPPQPIRTAPAPPPATTARAPAQRPPPSQPATQELSDSIPDTALEFNPEATDVSQVFIEAAPPKKIDLRPPEPAPVRQQERRAERPPARQTPRSPPPPPPPPPRDEEDIALDHELRSLAARLDATGKQETLKPDGKPAARKPKADTANEDARKAYAGSPYNSADEPANVARKAAANATRRSPVKPGAGALAANSAALDAPSFDEVGAAESAAELTPRRLSAGRKLAWIGGSVALVLALAAQAIHQNRHDLATKARLNRPLTRLYEAIGVPLVPRWNLASYDVRQLGAVSDPGGNGNLTVRASLKNGADQALPLPLLRITVQDRYGNRVATRDVSPKGYVPGAVPAGALLGAGQRIDAEMAFKDPGRDAVGFEIDACLPTPEGRIACANDAPAPR